MKRYLLAAVAVVAIEGIANAQQVPAQVHASIAQQDECDKRAHKSADKWMANYSPSGYERIAGESVESHMNARLGECLVLITGVAILTDRSAPYRIDPRIGVLFDAIGGHSFGYYYWDNPGDVVAPPARFCWVEGSVYTAAKPCLDQDDWYAAASKYMTD